MIIGVGVETGVDVGFGVGIEVGIELRVGVGVDVAREVGLDDSEGVGGIDVVNGERFDIEDVSSGIGVIEATAIGVDIGVDKGGIAEDNVSVGSIEVLLSVVKSKDCDDEASNNCS